MRALPGVHPTRAEEVWLRRAGRENALYNPAAHSVYLLNDTAAAIWHLCDGTTSPEEMIAAVCDASGLPEEVAAEDVRRILRDLQSAGLIMWTEDN